jgi:hypothetical protein
MSIGEAFDDRKIAIDIPPEPDPPATLLFSHMAKKKDIHPGDITRVLSQSMAKGSGPPARKSVVQDGVTYYAANQHSQYWASSNRPVRNGALIDRGANGGIDNQSKSPNGFDWLFLPVFDKLFIYHCSTTS